MNGEKKALELTECLKEYQKMNKPYPNLSDPVVTNLRFFIDIRNKIEHRYWDSSSLDILLFSEYQALLFNYESFLVTLFEEDYSINTCLAYALQFSHLRAKEQLQAQRDLLSKDMQDIKKYIDKYKTDLPQEIYDRQEYSIKLLQISKICPLVVLGSTLIAGIDILVDFLPVCRNANLIVGFRKFGPQSIPDKVVDGCLCFLLICPVVKLCDFNFDFLE